LDEVLLYRRAANETLPARFAIAASTAIARGLLIALIMIVDASSFSGGWPEIASNVPIPESRVVSFSPCVWSPAYNRNHFPETEIAL
jgi:hypothetical protein